ncbi:MAG TPA: M1 family aminopeptidase [Pyrinomonadaceae bacterium]|nr:M1 family aminopeptidase [Pyrinomonadaceae bacterium]
MLFRLIVITLFAAMSAFSQAQQSGPPIEPGVSQALAQWRAARYSDVRYKLNLTLEKMSPVLKGTMEIRVNVSAGTQAPSPANAGSSGVTTPIILDWRKIAGHEKDSTISNVSLNGVAISPRCGDAGGGACVPVEERNEHLIFRDGVVAGENVIKLDFTSPILTSGSAITRYVDKEDGAEYIYSLFVPSDASTAFPVFDQPDLKARFNLRLTFPRDWTAVSNSEIETRGGSTKDEDPDPVTGAFRKVTYERIFIFAETKPISTYVFAFAAGPWQEVGYTSINEDITKWNAPHFKLNTYVRKSQAAKYQPHAMEVGRLNYEGIKFLEQYFDYKFPFPKYDLVLIPEFPFGGMEHAGATFLREASIIFPTEPTKSDHISRANLIFHEAAHQWFGDTVTMRWFDDLWLKEGFAEFMAYKTLEKVMPEANAWKVFYERNKQAAYATDSTKGTTPIYQKIDNLSAAKSVYGNIVYRKAPSFLRQAEFYLGEQKFQTAARAFLKKHEYSNAGWEDLVREFENTRRAGAAKAIVGGRPDDLQSWAKQWVTVPGVPVLRTSTLNGSKGSCFSFGLTQTAQGIEPADWKMRLKPLIRFANGMKWDDSFLLLPQGSGAGACDYIENSEILFFFPNYQDYGYGIFLLDDKSRDYVLKNIQNEKDPFLRSMMWGALWDSVREAELDPKVYVELVVKNLATEQDETIIQSILGRVGTAMNYYLTDSKRSALVPRVEEVSFQGIAGSKTPGLRTVYFRTFLNLATSAQGATRLKNLLRSGKPNPKKEISGKNFFVALRTKDKFDIVTRLIILGDPEAPKLLAQLEKTETGDDAKRYAYAARAGIATAENKAEYWSDFTANKDISESWIEAAFGPFNSVRHSDLTLPYLEKALTELPNHKRTRKIFFVNGWLGAFIGGQKSEAALAIVNKFLADNPNLDRDLRLKILENVDLIERAVKIRKKFSHE